MEAMLDFQFTDHWQRNIHNSISNL